MYNLQTRALGKAYWLTNVNILFTIPSQELIFNSAVMHKKSPHHYNVGFFNDMDCRLIFPHTAERRTFDL